MGGWCEGRCQEAGGEKLEECCKGQQAEASKEGLGSEWAVVPMMMMMMMMNNCCHFQSVRLLCQGSLLIKRPTPSAGSDETVFGKDRDPVDFYLEGARFDSRHYITRYRKTDEVF